MEALSEPPGLFAAARRHWRHFVFAWSWPIFFYASSLGLSWCGFLTPRNEWVWFLGFETPVFWAAAYLASAPYRQRLIRTWQAVFWILVIPILLWLVLALLPAAILSLQAQWRR
jgi:hypothetical protein